MPPPDDPPDTRVAAAASASIPRAYRSFALGTGMWFGAWGMLQVLFSWLVVGELQASEELVGLAQMGSRHAPSPRRWPWRSGPAP